MPRSCSVCSHERTAEISKAISAGGSKRTFAARFGVSDDAIQRHKTNCLRLTSKRKEPGHAAALKGSADSGRFENGRCRTCGQLGPEADEKLLEPRAIVRRIEALIHRAERVADAAEETGNLSLVLNSIDRAQRGVDSLAKIAGLIKADGPTINVNTETLTLKRAFSIVVNAIDGEGRQVEFLRIFQAFYAGEPYELPITIDAGENGTQAALNPG
jgi:hypothetical protein